MGKGGGRERERERESERERGRQTDRQTDRARKTGKKKKEMMMNVTLDYIECFEHWAVKKKKERAACSSVFFSL